MKKAFIVTVAVSIAAAAAPAIAPASGGNDVRSTGKCSGSSTSKIKVKQRDGRLEVEFEVDQNRNGVPWTVKLSRNGTVVASMTATTRAPSGSFEIHRVIAGRLGTARVAAVATRASGETCTAAGSGTRANAPTSKTSRDDDGHDAGDDHGRHSGGHS
jgi:hypothetical protein